MKQSIWKYESIENLRQKWAGKKIVLSGGCFDVIHYGHFSFLRDAKRHGDVLIIALESDESILKRKKRKPIHTQQHRAEILASLDVVDDVILLPFFNSDEGYSGLVRLMCPTVVAVTAGDPHIEKKRRQAAQVGAAVVEVTKLLPEFSTSKILADS